MKEESLLREGEDVYFGANDKMVTLQWKGFITVMLKGNSEYRVY